MKNHKKKTIAALGLLLLAGYELRQAKKGQGHFDLLHRNFETDRISEKSSDWKVSGKETHAEADLIKDGAGHPPGLVEEGISLSTHGEDGTESSLVNRRAGLGIASNKLVEKSLSSETNGKADNLGLIGANQGQILPGTMSRDTAAGATGQLGLMGTAKAKAGAVKAESTAIDTFVGNRTVASAEGAEALLKAKDAGIAAKPEGMQDGAKVKSASEYAQGVSAQTGKASLPMGEGSGAFPGDQAPPPAIAVNFIRGSVFGPEGPAGPSKPVTNVPGFTKLFAPQNHNVTAGVGKQEQIYQTIAAGQYWDKSSQAMKVAENAQFEYANFATVPHRFGMTPVDSNKDPIGPRVEKATMVPYDQARYDANQAPDQARFSTGSDKGFMMVSCAIHPEIAFIMEIIGNDLMKQKGPMMGPNGGAHTLDAKLMNGLNPWADFAEMFRTIPKLVFASRSK